MALLKQGDNKGILPQNWLFLFDLSSVPLIRFRASGPVYSKNLKHKIVMECKETEERIMNTWFPQIIHILTSKEILNTVKEKKLDSFFKCASTLIANQVR